MITVGSSLPMFSSSSSSASADAPAGAGLAGGKLKENEPVPGAEGAVDMSVGFDKLKENVLLGG